MRRVPADLVHLTLQQSGITIAPATLWSWTRRRHITRTAEGYDLPEVLAYIERRAEKRQPV